MKQSAEGVLSKLRKISMGSPRTLMCPRDTCGRLLRFARNDYIFMNKSDALN